VRNKNAMLHRIAEVSLRSPKEQVETVIYPGDVDVAADATDTAALDDDEQAAA
jgi:hypothetical protein